MLAYGLDIAIARFPAAVAETSSLPAWEDLPVTQHHAQPPAETRFTAGPERCTLDAEGHFRVVVERVPHLTATVHAPDPLSDLELVHPVGAFLGAAVAHWRERAALHGLAVVVDDRAWVLLAAGGGGKSTLAAAFERRGVPVLADDLVVLDGDAALGGPRSCDLRQETAQALELDGRGVTLHKLSWRDRWRLPLSPAPYEVPLGGFVELAWSDHVDLSAVPLVERFASLGGSDALSLGAPRENGFLDLVDKPWWRLSRPQRFDALDQVVDAVSDLGRGQPTA